MGGGVEKWRLKLTSAKVLVEVEAELDKMLKIIVISLVFNKKGNGPIIFSN